jgi:Spy/CpxP family protein refolding chaperone
MFGFVLGTVCLIGLVGMATRGGRGYGGGCGRGGWGHHDGPRWRGGPGRWGHHGHHHHEHWRDGDDDDDERGAWMGGGFEAGARRDLRRKLNLREEQEDAVWSAVKEGRKAVDTFLADLRETRADLASAVRGETLDKDRLRAVFESHDGSLADARRDLVAALERAHASLDPEQRARIAELLERGGPGRWM